MSKLGLTMEIVLNVFGIFTVHLLLFDPTCQISKRSVFREGNYSYTVVN